MMRSISFLFAVSFLLVIGALTVVGCGGSGNRVVTETEEYSFDKMSELAQQDLDRSESFEVEEE